MANYERCTLCERPESIEQATDVQRVPSNVRRFCQEEFTLWRCGNCRSVHCLEDVDLAYYYEGYPLNELTLSPPIRMVYRNRLKWLRKAGFQPEHRLLDFGCGGGLFVRFLQENGFPAVTGYDSFLPRFAGDEVLQESHYDFVVSYDVIEHVEDPGAFFERLVPLLRPGGHLTVGTPRADGTALERKHDMVLHPPYHRHILSEVVLLNLGRRNG